MNHLCRQPFFVRINLLHKLSNLTFAPSFFSTQWNNFFLQKKAPIPTTPLEAKNTPAKRMIFCSTPKKLLSSIFFRQKFLRTMFRRKFYLMSVLWSERSRLAHSGFLWEMSNGKCREIELIQNPKSSGFSLGNIKEMLWNYFD